LFQLWSFRCFEITKHVHEGQVSGEVRRQNQEEEAEDVLRGEVEASYKSEESTYTENLVAEQETDHGVATLLQIVLTHREEQQRADHEDLEQHNHDPNRLPTTLT
jgi:hypothetical protein